MALMVESLNLTDCLLSLVSKLMALECLMTSGVLMLLKSSFTTTSASQPANARHCEAAHFSGGPPLRNVSSKISLA